LSILINSVEVIMKRALAVLVSALVSLAFAGIVAAQERAGSERYGTDTHPPLIEEQPGLSGDPVKAEKKAKKKAKKKARKSQKQMQETPPATTAPNPTATPVQPPPQQ
jgi:hypothetical protein